MDVTPEEHAQLIADLHRVLPQYNQAEFDPTCQLSMADLCKAWRCTTTTASRRARKARDAGVMRIIENVRYPNGTTGLAFEFVQTEEKK